MNKEKSIQNLILVSYLIFSLYYFYRYIFRYNSEMTSPTYTNTPLQFQIAKYIIALIILMAMLILLYFYDVKIRLGWPEILILLGVSFGFIKAVQQGSFDFFIKNFIFIIVAYSIAFIQSQSFEERFIKINKFIFLYHVLFSVIQISLYLIIGRLPALAYEGGLVRFGGGWDDPNAFAIYLVAPYCYSLCKILNSKQSRIIYYIVMLFSIFLEVLTFSFTGYLCFVFATLIMIIKFRHSKKMRLMLIFGVCLIIVGVAIMFNKIVEILEFKSGSLLIHFQSLKLQFENTLIGVLLGKNEFAFFENYYNILAYNYGLVYLIFSLALSLYFIVISYRVQRYYCKNTLFLVFYIFIVVYTICQFALPYPIIFPINYFYWLIAFWVLKEYRGIADIKSFSYQNVVSYLQNSVTK